MSFGKFLKKYASEISVVGDALGTIANVIPLNSKDKEKVAGAIQTTANAAKSIEATVESIQDISGNPIDKDALNATIAALLPALISTAVDKAVNEALKKAGVIKPAPKQVKAK